MTFLVHGLEDIFMMGVPIHDRVSVLSSCMPVPSFNIPATIACVTFQGIYASRYRRCTTIAL